MDARTLCLAVLHGGEASGYEIKKSFEEGPFSHFQAASFGAIYPALVQLANDGLVTVEQQEQDGRPDKKVYRLTEAGRRALVAGMAAEPGRDHMRSDFLFLMFFAQYLPPERAGRMIDERVAFYREWLARFDAMDQDPDCQAAGGHRFVRGFGRAVYGTAADYLETHRDQLLAELRAGVADAAE
jgi:PadR family transcriptional regulator, regulatory protein AphA